MKTKPRIKLNRGNRAERVEMPADVARDLKLANMMGGMMPPSYIAWHKQLALDVLDQLVLDHGIRVVEKTMRGGGWFDGMRELNVVVEDRMGITHRIVWCDSNQGFMEACRSGGKGGFDPDKLFGQPAVNIGRERIEVLAP